MTETERNATGELMALLQAMRADVDPPRATMQLEHLGDLRQALLNALAQVEEALAPAIVAGFKSGMTYVELANASSYASTTTITKIMRQQGASPGTGNTGRPPGWRKRNHQDRLSEASTY
jgi:hypothetical protein